MHAAFSDTCHISWCSDDMPQNLYVQAGPLGAHCKLAVAEGDQPHYRRLGQAEAPLG